MASGGGVSRVVRMVVCQLKRSARKEANQIEIKNAERENQRQARELKKAFLQEEKKAIAMEKKAQFKEAMTLASQAYKRRCMERKMLRERIINEELR